MGKNTNQIILSIAIIVFLFTFGTIFSKVIYKNETEDKNTKIEVNEVFAKQYIPKPHIVTILEKNEKETIINKKEETSKKETVNKNETKKVVVEEKKEEIIADSIVFDGLTMNELSEKLNKSLNSTLAGKGYLFAASSIESGVDPYLALAISLQETGCAWNCSSQVINCNNVGGQVGSPKCGNTSYKKFDTLDDGIKAYISNLKNNYYNYGLTTPETIFTKYASDPKWIERINNYINKIKSK